MKKIMLIIVVLIISTASFALALEKAANITPAPVQKKAPAVPIEKAKATDNKGTGTPAAKEDTKNMSNRSLAERIKGMLTREKGVINFVPGLREMKDADGNIFYTYNGTKLEDLNRDTLNKIFNRVRNEALRLRTERLQKQLNTVKQGQRLGGAAGRTLTPQIYVAPKLPSAPSQTPKIPKIPTTPPVTRR